MARGAPKGPGLRVMLSNPTEEKHMATRKRKPKKKRTAKKNPSRPRRRNKHGPRSQSGAATRAGGRQRRTGRRRHHNPAPARRRRRRHNPSFGGMEKLVMTGLKAIGGGVLGVLAGRLLESKVAQPPRTMGAIEVAAGLAGLWAGVKFGQPAIGLGFAGGLGGVQGGGKLLDSFMTPAAPPAMPPPPGGAPQMPPAATPPDAMAAVEAVDEDGDMEGAEGMAAVETADDDEDDDEDTSGEFTQDGGFPFTGSTPEYG